MYFSKATALALTAFLQIIATSAAPVSIRDGTTSASYAKLQKPIISPYYVYFGDQSIKLADAFDSLKMTAATVGFASAPKGSCKLTADLDNLVPDVQAFIGKGGAVSLSFGGNLQNPNPPRQHIQQACSDAPSLTKLIEDSMTKFNTHNIEFDIEDNDLLSDTDASKRLADALVQVKKDIPDTFVTYTVGTTTKGMPGQQVAYVQAAKDAGLTIDSLILMTMNMGGTDDVADAQTAVAGGAAQLAKIYGLTDPSAGFNKMGMLPAIGVDNDHVVVDLKGMTTLGQFAKAKGMSTVSYWNFNRDFPGGDPKSDQSLTSSSSPDQTKPSQFLTTLQSSLTTNVASGISSAAAAIKAALPPAAAAAQQPAQKASVPGVSGGTVAASA